MIIPQCCSLLSGRPGPAANEAVADLAARLATGRRGAVRAMLRHVLPWQSLTWSMRLAEPVAVLPLFLTEGLLLAPVRALAAQRGWRIIEPLGERAAGLVRRRYDSALGIQVS